MRFRVAGVTFRRPHYPGNLWALRDLVEGAKVDAVLDPTGGFGDDLDEFGGVSAALVRDAQNEHDPNAIEVHVPALGRRLSWVGFVPAELAAKLAPRMDNGVKLEAVVRGVFVDPGHEEKPGCEIAARPREDDGS